MTWRQTFSMSGTESGESNALRMFFTFWLNTGALDAAIVEEVEKGFVTKKKDANNVGLEFMRRRWDDIRVFADWLRSNEIGAFAMECALINVVADRLREIPKPPKDGEYYWSGAHGEFARILGNRIKDNTAVGRASLPKDIVKSFTKQGSKLVKEFATEFMSLHSEYTRPFSRQEGYDSAELWRETNGGQDRPTSIRAWLEFTLGPYGGRMNGNLGKLRRLHSKMSKHEDISGIVDRLMREAEVHEVMSS